MILDAGVLVAIERDESDAKDFVEAALQTREPLRTTAPIVSQVWRDGARQVLLTRFLPSVDVLAFTANHVPLVGTLLRHSGTADVVDAHMLACAIHLEDSIITSDLGDFAHLAGHLGAESPSIHHWR